MARSRLFSMDARRAARKIVGAMRWGDGEVVLGWQAKVARLGKELLPSFTSHALSMLDRHLPPEGAYVEIASGRDIANARRLRTFGPVAR
jgi:hypothetical protein